MSLKRLIIITTLALFAFAANSILCRIALAENLISPGDFTAIRIVSGAIALYAIVWITSPKGDSKGSWQSAVALFIYASGFSFAYIQLDSGLGALVLFGSVQLTMMGWSYWKGVRFNFLQLLGIVIAIVGLVNLMLPSDATSDISSLLMMLSAGVAWGVYSIRGAMSGQALKSTATNFLYASFPALFLVFIPSTTFITMNGLLLAVVSGAITSGVGYALWYSSLEHIRSHSASIIQLTVPVITVVLGMVLLDENISLKMAFSCLAIILGVLLVIVNKAKM